MRPAILTRVLSTSRAYEHLRWSCWWLVQFTNAYIFEYRAKMPTAQTKIWLSPNHWSKHQQKPSNTLISSDKSPWFHLLNLTENHLKSLVFYQQIHPPWLHPTSPLGIRGTAPGGAGHGRSSARGCHLHLHRDERHLGGLACWLGRYGYWCQALGRWEVGMLGWLIDVPLKKRIALLKKLLFLLFFWFSGASPENPRLFGCCFNPQVFFVKPRGKNMTAEPYDN